MSDLVLNVPPNHRRGSSTRSSVSDWLTSAGTDVDTIADVTLVVSELFCNAVTATRGHQPVEVRLHLRGRSLLIGISNHGPGFDPDGIPPSDPGRIGGRGLEIVRTLGELRVQQIGERTTVWALLDTELRAPATGDHAREPFASRSLSSSGRR